jgi:hypothetical protein
MPVDTDVVRLIAGPAHCGYESTLMLTLGWPAGEIITDDNTRQYVRDPLHVLQKETLANYIPAMALPDGAYFSGFAYQGDELWVANETVGTQIYMVRDGTVEQWPRAQRPIGCM